MRYGNGISKLKNHQAVPDDRLLQFAISLTATHPLTDSAEQRQGEKICFSPVTNTKSRSLTGETLCGMNWQKFAHSRVDVESDDGSTQGT
jgi:hypothetical protein